MCVQVPSQMPEWDHYSKILDIVPEAEQRESTRGRAVSVAQGARKREERDLPAEEVITERGS